MNSFVVINWKILAILYKHAQIKTKCQIYYIGNFFIELPIASIISLPMNMAHVLIM